MMAAFDIFEVIVRGRGAHAAMPHTGVDPVVTAAQIVTGLQTIASRNTHPVDAAVVSVTQIHAGDTWNVIPAEVVIRGTTRSFKPEVRDSLEPAVRRIAEGIAAAHGATASLRYERRYPPTINTPEATPTMGAEDFAFMLEQKPGCYVWIGNGPSDNERVLHSPHYDFNDEVLPIGASYWARLVETTLAA
jgi:hippurate hydrolase